MRVLVLTARPKLSARTVRAWRGELGVGRKQLAVVAMPDKFAGKPMPVESVTMLPRRRRPGALPWSAATSSGRPPRVLGGRRLQRAFEARVGRTFDDWRARSTKEFAPEVVSVRFADQCSRSEKVRKQFAAAAVVVAADAAACRAAWQLAQEYDGPRVVFGVAAGLQAVGELKDRRQCG